MATRARDTASSSPARLSSRARPRARFDLTRLRAARAWWARYPSELSLLGLTLALAVMLGAARGFAHGQVGAASAALLIVLACSLARRVERDLRADTVYPGLPWLRHVMLALGWLMRPYAPNPWVRIELRSLGLPETKLRELTALRLVEHFVVLYGPLTWLYAGCMVWCAVLFSGERQGALTASMEQALPLAQLIAVVWLLPGLLQTSWLVAARLWRADELTSACRERAQVTLRRVRDSVPGLRA